MCPTPAAYPCFNLSDKHNTRVSPRPPYNKTTHPLIQKHQSNPDRHAGVIIKMRPPAPLLLLAAAAAPSALGFVPSPAPTQQQQQRTAAARPTAPLASSYYDDYDAQRARNMEQDRCVCSWLSMAGLRMREWGGSLGQGTDR
jgi:hypothetical protein